MTENPYDGVLRFKEVLSHSKTSNNDKESEKAFKRTLGFCFNASLVNQLTNKLQSYNKSFSFVMDYLLLKVTRIQSFYRMKIARRMYLLTKKAGQIFLMSGPARLTHSSKQRGSRLENTRQTTWLQLRPFSLKFQIYSFERKDKRAWTTTVSLSEMRQLKTDCPEILRLKAILESRAYLESLSKFEFISSW